MTLTEKLAVARKEIRLLKKQLSALEVENATKERHNSLYLSWLTEEQRRFREAEVRAYKLDQSRLALIHSVQERLKQLKP